MEIQKSIESRRGCGYRKSGGLYLVGDSFGEGCHRLPFDLTLCPLCGHGIRPSRAWTWIDGVKLFGDACLWREGVPEGDPPEPIEPGDYGYRDHCFGCIICNSSLLIPTDEIKEGEEHPNRGKSGLIWVGAKFYRFPEAFIAEANRINISRRIKAVPQGFELGVTWVFLAHKKAIFNREDGKVTYKPGIFRAYRPTGIEYIVKGDETDEALEKKIKRGITLVKVEKEGVTSDMDLETPKDNTLTIKHDGDLMPNTTSPTARLDITDKKIEPDLPVYDIPLSRRACAALEAYGLKNAKELLSMTKADLLKIKGIGKKSANEIAKQLGLGDK